MKTIIFITIVVLLNVCVFAQPKGIMQINNIEVYGEIIPEFEVLNTSPDLVITQDSSNKKTTYTGVSEVTGLSFQDLADSVSMNAVFDSLATIKFKLADSSAVAITTDNDTLATTPWVRDYVGSSVTIGGNNNEILMSDGSGGAKTDSDFSWNDTAFVATSSIGTNNMFLGYLSGSHVQSGANSNISLGINTLNKVTLGDYNIALGANSGNNIVSGVSNINIGTQSGFTNSIGNQNIFIGDQAGYSATSNYNIFIGNQSGYNNTGSNNVFLGYQNSKYRTGSNNTIIGAQANGSGVAGGSNNIFIGYQSGYNNTGSSKLIIENSNSTTPLIYGEFDNNIVKINGTQIKSTGTITDNDATPDVSNAEIWTYNGTANSVTITDLDNPVVGAIYTIVGNSDTYTITINDSGNFNMTGTIVLGVDDNVKIYVQGDNDYIQWSPVVNN